MKTLYLILLLFITVSCATKPTTSITSQEEYEILRLATEQYKTAISEEFRLIEKPYNEFIKKYYNGFYQHPFYNGSLELPGVTFSLKDNPVTQWEEKIIRKTIATKKVNIIPDFEKIKLVTDPEKALSFFSFSNPIFSNDGQYALININVFPNLIAFGSTGYIMIFKKINGNWTYIDKFAAYVS